MDDFEVICKEIEIKVRNKCIPFKEFMFKLKRDVAESNEYYTKLQSLATPPVNMDKLKQHISDNERRVNQLNDDRAAYLAGAQEFLLRNNNPTLVQTVSSFVSSIFGSKFPTKGGTKHRKRTRRKTRKRQKTRKRTRRKTQKPRKRQKTRKRTRR